MTVHMLLCPSVATSRRPHVTRRHLGLDKDPRDPRCPHAQYAIMMSKTHATRGVVGGSQSLP
eukprot:6376882-Prymnesium_polylepis.1